MRRCGARPVRPPNLWRPAIHTLPALDLPTVVSDEPKLTRDLARVVEQLQASAPDLDREGAVADQQVALLAEAGLLGAPAPRAFGGLGLGTEGGDTTTLLGLLSEIGRGNLSLGRIYEGHVNALQLICTYGTRQQMEQAAADARHGRLLFGVWNTEAGDGVTFEPVGAGRLRLTGAKTFASGAGIVARAIVPGRLPDGGWQMSLVSMDQVTTSIDPSWWRPMGMYGSGSFKVDFTGVEICKEQLIGASGDYQRQPWISAGAIRFAAVQLGGAEALFDVARTELRTLDRAGDPHQQARFGQLAVAIESGRLWLRGAAPFMDQAFSGPASGGIGQRVRRACGCLHQHGADGHRANLPRHASSWWSDPLASAVC